MSSYGKLWLDSARCSTWMRELPGAGNGGNGSNGGKKGKAKGKGKNTTEQWRTERGPVETDGNKRGNGS